MIDFAGGGVVHVTGGLTALFATMILGPRRGRFRDEEGKLLEVPKEFPGHSMALQMLGAFILWFGWYGFNAGSALALPYDSVGRAATLAGVNTTLAAGMGGMTALFANLYILERLTGEPFFDLRYAMNGTISGLVAITAGCGVLEPWAAVVVGFVAGLLYIGGSKLLLVLRLDDAVDAIPCHLVNGAWGVIANGFFASPSRLLIAYGRDKHVGWVYSWSRGSGDATLLGTQLIGLLFIFGWVLFLMLPFFVWLDWMGWFRSDPLEEIVGLDTSYHGGCVLSGDSDVQPEYISAFNKRKEEKKMNKMGNRGPMGGTSLYDMEQEEDDTTGLGDGEDEEHAVDAY
jgi:Amt family ammonium transporter